MSFSGMLCCYHIYLHTTLLCSHTLLLKARLKVFVIFYYNHTFKAVSVTYAFFLYYRSGYQNESNTRKLLKFGKMQIVENYDSEGGGI